MNKVFGIGMFKTGTTSLGLALRILGYRILLAPWWPEEMIMDPWYERPGDWPAYDSIIRAQIERYDAFKDYPWMFCFKQCDQWYPGSKFILTERDAERVALSDRNMWKTQGIHDPKTRKKTLPKDVEVPSKEAFIERYESHNKAVKQYFRDRDNLLIINLESGGDWPQICDFLGQPIPAQAFPHVNKGAYDL